MIKRTIIIILAFAVVLPACTKVEKIRTSGIDTIDNSKYHTTTYFVYGFSFSSAKLVPTYPSPGPDIVIYLNNDDPISRLTLQANNLKPSFYKAGDYSDAEAAKAAFENLKTISVPKWEDMADPIAVNQVWIYRTGSERFVKLRIISTVNEVRNSIPYAECTFQWVYQPDGSSTFPGK